MKIDEVSRTLIERINRGDEKAFDTLYNSYFVYLCTCANSYIFNRSEAQGIVNEVFMKVWFNREELSFPVHSYLMRSVQNGCLNHLRALRSRERIMDEYRASLLEFQEEYCMTECNPLGLLEMADLEHQVRTVIASLPDRCRTVFEQYLYSNLTPQEIAGRNAISVNTVRVHIKNAMDKIRERLGSRFGILVLLLFA